MVAPKQHIVTANETLSGIAAKYGFSDYKLIFQAACNSDLRQLRQRPELIRPGDRVVNPPNPAELRTLLQSRLAALRKLRTETVCLFERMDGDLDRSYKAYKTNANAIDYIGAVMTVLTGMVSTGFKTMNLTGKQLADANTKLGWAALKFAYKPHL